MESCIRQACNCTVQFRCAITLTPPSMSMVPGSLASCSVVQQSVCSAEEDVDSLSSYSSEPFHVPTGELPRATAARSLQMAWSVLHSLLDSHLLKKSFLMTARRVSTSCTGAYTIEMGLAVLEKTINDSGLVWPPISLKGSSCHETRARFFLAIPTYKLQGSR